MSVLAFKDCQQQVVTLIQGDSYFSGETVILAQGRQLEEQEQALRELGQVTVVFPIQDFGSARNGLGTAVVKANIDVLFAFNPEKGTKDIYDMVTKGIGAVLNYFVPNLPQDRFEVTSGYVETYDDGFWGYMVSFSKAVQFT